MTMLWAGQYHNLGCKKGVSWKLVLNKKMVLKKKNMKMKMRMIFAY